MWLFDDILKKPTPAPVDPLAGWTPGQWSGQPPQDDSTTPVVATEWAPMPKFVIEKSAETTIFGQDIETKSVDDGNKAASEPTIHAEEAGSSLLISTEAPVMTSEESPSIMEVPLPASDMMLSDAALAPVAEATVEASVTETIETPTSSDLFAQLTDTTETVTTPEAETVTESPLFGETPAVSTGFANPQEFIEKSLEGIGTMIANIDKKHDAKIVEAEGYGKEKDRYTLLEKTAYEEASSMDDEKAHAVHMREILENERHTDAQESPEEAVTARESTEDTLSLLAKENEQREPSLSKVKEATKKEEDLMALTGL